MPYAAIGGFINVANLLIGQGCILSLHNDDGRTALYLSLTQRHGAVAKVISESDGVAVTLESLSWLHAARLGFDDDEVVQRLLRARCNPNVNNDKGDCGLYFVAFEGHITVVRSLLAAQTIFDSPNEIGHTPISAAVGRGHTDIVQMFPDSATPYVSPPRQVYNSL